MAFLAFLRVLRSKARLKKQPLAPFISEIWGLQPENLISFNGGAERGSGVAFHGRREQKRYFRHGLGRVCVWNPAIQSSPQTKGRGKEKQEPPVVFETLPLTPISLTHITQHTSAQSARAVRARGPPSSSSPGGATRRAARGSQRAASALRVRCAPEATAPCHTSSPFVLIHQAAPGLCMRRQRAMR